MKEVPGASTPWARVNQLLNPQERFTIHQDDWQAFLLVPSHSSQLAALLYFFYQEKISFHSVGNTTNSFLKLKSSVIISNRAFSSIKWYEQGVVEVGGGCSLSCLHQFLLERDQEIPLDEGPLFSPKQSIADFILLGRITGLRYREESFFKMILGVEFITSEGSQVKWGGIHKSSGGGPTLHELMCGIESFPGIIIKMMFKTYPIPSQRLSLAWVSRRKEELLEHLHDLKNFSSSWEYLEMVQAAELGSQAFVFAQISGLADEMEAFSLVCPSFSKASLQGEKLKIKQFFCQKKLQAHWIPNKDCLLVSAKMRKTTEDYSLKSGEYLWFQEWSPGAWLLTDQSIKIDEYKHSLPVWKQRFLESFN